MDRAEQRRRYLIARETGRRLHKEDWFPNPGPQTRFLQLTCREALYGGAAGGGKTIALIVDALRYVGVGYGRDFSGIILRRTFPELEKHVVPATFELYTRLGGKYNGQDHRWTFPDGETIRLGYCDHESDKYRYQGTEFQYCGFDELTQFTESQYKYIGFSRVRSAKGIPLRTRASTNPGGDGHDWVFARFSPWLNPEAEFRADPEKILFYGKDLDGNDVLSESGVMDCHGLAPIGRTFVPAKLADNPALAGGDYERGLMELDRVTRMQLRDGNWLVKPSAKMYFDRNHFDIVDIPPAKVDAKIRYWDRASTGESEASKRKRGSDPDYTVGLLLSKVGHLFFVEDVVRFRKKPAEVKAAIKRTAELDGTDVLIGLEQDPGQAGQFEIDEYITYLNGWHVRAFSARQDKITRAGPISSQCEVGNVKLVKGAWNNQFVSELEDFPEGSHDDQVDALSGAYNSIGRGFLRSAGKHPTAKITNGIFGASGGW